jgi:hypothetical protein
MQLLRRLQLPLISGLLIASCEIHYMLDARALCQLDCTTSV